MLDSSSGVCVDSEPDFIEFLGDELQVDAHEVTALLGRWLLDYKPQTVREIQVLKPRAPQFSMEVAL